MTRQITKPMLPVDLSTMRVLMNRLEDAAASLIEQPWRPDHKPTPNEIDAENKALLNAKKESDDAVIDILTAFGYTDITMRTTVAKHGPDGLTREPMVVRARI